MKTKKLPSGYRMLIPVNKIERAFLTNLINVHIRTLCLYTDSEFRQRNETWKCGRMGDDGYAKLTAEVDLDRTYHFVPPADKPTILRLRSSVTFTDGEMIFWVQDDRGGRASLEEYVRELVDAPYCPFVTPL